MTGVDERNQDKNTVVPKLFLMIFSDEMMGYRGELRRVLQLSGKGKYLTSFFKYLNKSKILKP